MFNNEMMADVHFIVGPSGESQRVPAHKVSSAAATAARGETERTERVLSIRVRIASLSKVSLFVSCCLQYVLAVGSSVFCAMFYGDLAEEESEIHIPDVEPAAFLILLK